MRPGELDNRRRRQATALVLAVLGSLLPASSAVALTSLSVPYPAGADIRDIAETYLGDADLWPAILKETGVNSIAELAPGQVLKVPASEVEAARSALKSSLTKIQDANAIGAQLFAFEQITKAVGLHDAALNQQKAGNWSQTLALAVEADQAAVSAFSLAEQNRDQAAEARLSDRQGWVEGQRPADLGWADRQLNAILIEEEKIRTLSRSTAQITFRDAGRLRLNANSHAVIQRMRVDPLKKREDAKVSLVEGDFYALLGSNSTRKNLEVDVPDVQARIDSGDFWVRQDVSGAKFTNYDDERVLIAARGDTVDLGRNEGVVIRSGEPPRDKIDLLSEPILAAPVDDGVVYNSEARLSWSPIQNAAGYWLEVGFDPGFNAMVQSISSLQEPTYTLSELDAGLYYWRVSALDQYGLPGPRSQTRRFDMRIDTAPPYLQIQTPETNAIYREASILVTGESEPDAEVFVEGLPADMAADGTYSATITAVEGANRISIVAIDPAGNSTTTDREFVHMPDSKAVIAFDEELPRQGVTTFVTSSDTVTLTGTTTENARLEISGADNTVRVTAKTDAAGRFAITLDVAEGGEAFTMEVIAATGFGSSGTFDVVRDTTGPEIALEAPLPKLTAVEWLPLRGTVSGSTSVVLNGREIPLSDGIFDEVVTLVEGQNELQMTATDEAGNITVEKWSVTLDQEAPAYVKHNVKPASGGRVAVEVFAKDATGLAKAAPFTLLANGEEIQGFLRYNKLSRSYKGAVPVAAGSAGATLAEVELQDDAGNRARVRLN